MQYMLAALLSATTMRATTRDFTFILETYFAPDDNFTRMLYVLTAVLSLWPLWRLHRRQSQDPRQPALTAWSKSIRSSLRSAATDVHLLGAGEPLDEGVADDIHADLGLLYEFLGIDPAAEDEPQRPPPPPIILCTMRLECTRCPPTVTRRSLRRRVDPQKIRVLSADLKWKPAILYIGHCAACRADYYPDRITYKAENGQRLQILEYNSQYLRISKHGLWASHRIARAQEHALTCFHAGWSNFANWVNRLLQADRPLLTNRQSQRLFLEHFSRRLLVAHNLTDDFRVPAHSDAATLARHVRELLGVGGGSFPDSFDHGCTECTHAKRYRADLVEEGLVLGGVQAANEVAGLPIEVSVRLLIAYALVHRCMFPGQCSPGPRTSCCSTSCTPPRRSTCCSPRSTRSSSWRGTGIRADGCHGWKDNHT